MKIALLLALASIATASMITPPLPPEVQEQSGLRAPIFDEAETAKKTATDALPGQSKAREISALTYGVKTVFTLEDIAKILPHRYLFLLVDKVVKYVAGKHAVGIKSVTFNEPHFTGRFPNLPIMPGVLQVEALAQLAGIVCLHMEGVKSGAVFFFAGVDGVKWKKPVVPGDLLVMEVEIKMWNGSIAKATGKAFVDGEMVVDVNAM
ncbi:hypothetical protein ACHAWF_001970 [Thalassiosira exigua]